MSNRIFPHLAPFLVAALLSGCAVVPFLPFVPIMGSAYQGYVIWKGGKATKYYAYNLETTHRAVMQTTEQLELQVILIKSAPKEGFSLEIKGNVPMHIDILPREKGVTAVIVSISTFGDKNYVELFYSLIDDYLPKRAAVGKEKTQ